MARRYLLAAVLALIIFTTEGISFAVSIADVQHIGVGSGHTVAVKSDGTVWAWGNNSSGQLGDGTYTQKTTPVQVTGLTGTVVAVAAGDYHTVAVKSDGTVWAWGNNNYGQLGDGTYTSRTTSVQVTGLTGTVVAVAVGRLHTVAVKSDGTVWTWGYNYFGQLGDGTTTQRTTPVQVTGLTGTVVAVAAGGYHTVAVKSDGTVWAWGNNNYGQLGDGTTTQRTTPVQVTGLTGTVIAVVGGTYHTIALKSDGTVWAWGANYSGQLGDGTTLWLRPTPVQVTGLTGTVAAIAAGDMHTVAVKSDGTVWAWGYNANGQLGDGTTTQRPSPVQVTGLTGTFFAVGAGTYHTIALKSDGTVWAWGNDNYGQLGVGTTTQTSTSTQVVGLSGTVVAVGAGDSHSVALKSDGTVWAWGSNYAGQLGDGTTVHSPIPVQVTGYTGTVVAVAAGGMHTVAVKSDGTAWAWGDNSYGQLGDGTTAQRTTPVQVTGLTGTVVAVAAGSSFAIALKSDGTVWAWGDNGYGQLGDGTTTQRTAPVQVIGLTGTVVAVAAGSSFAIALKSDGTVWAWGDNGYRQLGDGTTMQRTTPVQVDGLVDVIAVAAGGAHTVAVKSDGTVWAWGNNWYGQLGDGTFTQTVTPVLVSGLSDVVAVAAGAFHTVAVKNEGTVWAWGANSYGQLGDGTTTQRNTPVQVTGIPGTVVDVAAGGNHTVAVTNDGVVWAWGDNSNGQLGIGGSPMLTSPLKVNSPPAPSAAAITTTIDVPGESQVVPNDPDPSDSHAYAILTQGLNGTASVDASGLAVYTPNAGFSGRDSFWITVADNDNGKGYVMIAVTVVDTSDITPPVTSASAAGYVFGTLSSAASIDVMLSASDAGSGIRPGYPKFCIDSSDTCAPNVSYSGLVRVFCVSGSVCDHYVRFQSMDNGGNMEQVKSVAVLQDLESPTLSATAAWVDSTHVDVTYSEPVAGATTTANYTADNGLSIVGATSQGGNVYRLTTSLQAVGTAYTITASTSGIADTVGNALSSSAHTTTFTRTTANNTAPTAPTLSAPANASEVLSTTPTLTVNASTDVDGDPVTYTYEVYSDATLSTRVASVTGGGTSWNVDVPLSDNSLYWWHARATDGTASSGWMSTASFFLNTVNDAPTVPGISSPALDSQVTTTAPVLTITNSTDPDIYDVITYDFDVASDSGFNVIVSNATGISQGTGGSTSWAPGELSDNTTYWWRARAVDNHGGTSNWASGSFFANTANDAPSTPTINSPASGSESISTTPALVVNDSTDLDLDTLHYVFEIDRVNTFDSLDKQTSGLMAEGAGTTSWTPTALQENTTYYWRVKANDGLADSGWMTTASLFVNTANDPPTSPTLLNPADGSDVTVLAPTLSLNAAGDPDNDSLTYDFQVYSDSGLTTLVTSTTGAGTSWVVTPDLLDNTTYYWTARAVDEHGLAGAWMAASSFFVNNNGYNDPPTITITKPGAAEPTVAGNSFTITWTDSDPDSNAMITLGYDTLGTGCSGTTIATGISEDDPANAYAWDITGLPEGTYSIYAVIDDGTTSVCSYAAGPITRLNRSGDVNNDGTVDMADALEALRIASGLDTARSDQMIRGDVAPVVGGTPQPDGKITIGDVVVILRKAVGLMSW